MINSLLFYGSLTFYLIGITMCTNYIYYGNCYCKNSNKNNEYKEIADSV